MPVPEEFRSFMLAKRREMMTDGVKVGASVTLAGLLLAYRDGILTSRLAGEVAALNILVGLWGGIAGYLMPERKSKP